MVEIKLGRRTVDLPFILRIQGITEEMFEEMVDEDTKADLFDGTMIVYSFPPLSVGQFRGFLSDVTALFASERRMGMVSGPNTVFRLSSSRLIMPDIFYLKRHRLGRPVTGPWFEGVPDLAMEMLMPWNAEEKLGCKRAAYRDAGVPEIWFVDPDNREIIIDRRRGRTAYTTTKISKGKVVSQALPGFWIEATWLWSSPLPRELACLRKILK